LHRAGRYDVCLTFSLYTALLASSMGNQGSVDRAFAEAVRLHQRGELGGAVRIYERIVRKIPDHAVAHNLLGLSYFQSGKLEEAAASIEKALSLKPDLTDAHYNLGIVLYGLGRYEDAVDHFRRFLALKPGDAEARNSLGASLKELGRLDAAIEAFQRAVDSQPLYAEALLNLGSALLASDRNAEAATHLQRAAALRPDLPDAHTLLGNVLLKLNRAEDAVQAHRQALVLRPNVPEAHCDLAASLRAAEKDEEALGEYEQALTLKPDFADAYLERGILLTKLERYDEAVASFDHAIGLDPAFANAYSLKGVALQVLGRLDEARSCFERAIDLGPDNIGAHYHLVRMKRVRADDPQLTTLEGLLPELPSRPMEDRIGLHLALGKAFADTDQQARSFRHIAEANALMRSQNGYDEAATLGLFERLRAVFTPELMREKRCLGDPSNVPIFIVGMARSGTSLVEQILASHPNVFGAGEREDFIMPALDLRRGTAVAFPEIVDGMTGRELRQFGADYLRRIQVPPGATRITDKLPANFQMAGFIHLTLPNARIVHMRRDPLDNCISCFATMFKHTHAYMNDMGDLGRYYRAYEALMDHWRRVLPDGVMLDVQYEDVVYDLEGQARRIFAHCGLEWDDACLSFHKTERPVRTASVAQVRQPIYRSSIGRAQAYRDQLGPLLNALGIE
jgi:tetratricopeptide (TPR) repeat protein